MPRFLLKRCCFWVPRDAEIWTAEDRTVKTRAALKRAKIAPFAQRVVGERTDK